MRLLSTEHSDREKKTRVGRVWSCGGGSPSRVQLVPTPMRRETHDPRMAGNVAGVIGWVTITDGLIETCVGARSTLSQLVWPSESIIGLFGRNQQKVKTGLCRDILTTDHALVCDQVHNLRSVSDSVSADGCCCSFNTLSSRYATMPNPLSPTGTRRLTCPTLRSAITQVPSVPSRTSSSLLDGPQERRSRSRTGMSFGSWMVQS